MFCPLSLTKLNSFFFPYLFFLFFFTKHILTIIHTQQISTSSWRFVCSVYITYTNTFLFHSLLCCSISAVISLKTYTSVHLHPRVPSPSDSISLTCSLTYSYFFPSIRCAHSRTYTLINHKVSTYVSEILNL